MAAVLTFKRPAAVLVVMLPAMVPFAVFNNQKLADRSAAGSARLLAQIAPPNSVVLTGVTMMDQPELFHYAHVTPDSRLLDPSATPLTDHWLILKGDENDRWRARLGSDLGETVPLWPAKQMNAVWYSVSGRPPA